MGAYTLSQVMDIANNAYKEGHEKGRKVGVATDNNKDLSDYLFKAANLVNDIYIAGLREGGKVAIEGIGKKSEKEVKKDE